jgi:hypothetical protein
VADLSATGDYTAKRDKWIADRNELYKPAVLRAASKPKKPHSEQRVIGVKM